MSQTKALLGLDIGSVRIGVAMADTTMRIAVPQGAVPVDGSEITAIHDMIKANDIDTVVVGYPRNQSGDTTQQTSYVEQVAERISAPHVVFQDESLTSVLAEGRLKARGKPYSKEDIDAEAAVLILTDYLELHP